MSEVLEIQQMVEHLQGALENLVTRGLRTAGSAERNMLATLGEEFERIGATHLAGRVLAMHEGLETDSAAAPKLLFMAQASLRVFERILTLEMARAALVQLQQVQSATREVADEPQPE
jgi:hypothetical protein